MPRKKPESQPVEVAVEGPADVHVEEKPDSTPLGIPEGSVRAILALFVVVASWLGGLVLLGLGTIDFDKFVAIIGLSGAVVGYYFAARR